MGIKKNRYVIFFLIAIFCGCIKDELVWDLKKVNRLATVITLNAKNISNTGSTIDSEVEYDGGSNVTQRGVCWSTNPNPTIANNVTNNGTGIGSFTSSITGLNANTTYYCRAYATNGVGTAYGNQINFTTSNVSASLPTLTTTSASGISTNSASGGGNISSDGGSSVTQRGVCWSTNPNPTIANNVTNSGTGIGSFTSSITGLNANTTYYCRAYATNGVGTAYGNEVSFATICSAPTVSISSATYTYSHTNQVGKFYYTNLCGIVSNQGGGTITNSNCIFWFNQTNPPGAGLGTVSYTGLNIPFCITPVTQSGTYYLQIEVTNSCGGTAKSPVQQIILP